MIELVARFRAIGVVQAAREVARHLAIDLTPTHKEREDDEAIASPVGLLWPRHEMVQALGVRPQTAKAFGAGYCAEYDRFVVPIFNDYGALLSHVGVKAGERDSYPDGFDGRQVLFNAHRVFPADCLYVTDSPLNVLRAHQEGRVNAVSIFGVYDADRLFALSSFVRRRKIEWVKFF